MTDHPNDGGAKPQGVAMSIALTIGASAAESPIGDAVDARDRKDIEGPALILIGRAAAEGALSLAEPLAPARVLAA